MAFDLTLLATTADCDLFLALCAKDKADTFFEKLSTERERDEDLLSATKTASELLTTNAKLASLASIILTLSPGPDLDVQLNEQHKFEVRRYTLERRKLTHGKVAIAGQNLKILKLEADTTVVDGITAEVTTHRATL